MDTPDPKRREHFEHLRQRRQGELARGELEQALATSDEAVAWAREHGEEGERDLAACNRAAILIHLGRVDEVLSALPRLLMRCPDAENRCHAAAIISDGYQIRHNPERSRSYARQALGYAEQVGSSVLLARCHNQVANLDLQDSRFDEALSHYLAAFSRLSPEQSVERATLHANIGYCHLASGRVPEGFRELFAAWRLALRLELRWSHFLGRLRLALSYGYLETANYRRAGIHGRAGLEIGERAGDTEIVKKALYLLGEAAKLGGDEFLAFEYFSRLQRQFYPEHAFLTDSLMSMSTRQLVNLWV